MDILKIKKQDIKSYTKKTPIGNRLGLNMSVAFNNETKRFELFLVLRTKSLCDVMIFDDPLEVESLISSLKNAKEAMESSVIKTIN